MEKKAYKINQSTLTIHVGDLTTSNTDIIVSSGVGGALSTAILQAGGEQIYKDIVKHNPDRLGDVIVTTAGELSAKYIFHAITTGYMITKYQKKAYIEILFDIIQKSFQLMDVLDIQSIAFPALGTGGAGFNYEVTATIMSGLISKELQNKAKKFDVQIYLYSDFKINVFLDEFDHLQQSENLNLLHKSIALVQLKSSSIEHQARALILKSKFYLVEGNIEEAMKYLKDSLKITQNHELVILHRDIKNEIEKLQRDYRFWKDRSKNNKMFYSSLDSLDLQNYIWDAKEVLKNYEKPTT